ncbi:MAG: hypothetical protein D6731_15760 [Planctomycetota bacterium]|nr:MAG: hypothetical protein D6731_15760 [Planctomycetota bacterium]
MASALLLARALPETDAGFAVFGVALFLVSLRGQRPRRAFFLAALQAGGLGMLLFEDLALAARDSLGWPWPASGALVFAALLLYSLPRAAVAPQLARLLVCRGVHGPLVGSALCVLAERATRLGCGGMAVGELGSLAPAGGMAGEVALFCAAWAASGVLRRSRRAGAVASALACSLVFAAVAQGSRARAPRFECGSASVLLLPGPAWGLSGDEEPIVEAILELSLARSRALLRGSERLVDLVVWPEGISALDLCRRPSLRCRLARGLRVERNRPCLLLGECHRGPGGELQNAALLLDGEGRVVGRYLRERLLPFGERTPELCAWLVGRGEDEFVPGPSGQPLLRLPTACGRSLRLRIRLCAEALLPERYNGPKPDLDVVLASDAMFPPESPLAKLVEADTAARSRAGGVPLVRVARGGGALLASGEAIRRAAGPLLLRLSWGADGPQTVVSDLAGAEPNAADCGGWIGTVFAGGKPGNATTPTEGSSQ